MSEPFQLLTNCVFKGKDYLVKMCVWNSKKLELTVTQKHLAEEWQCEYDASYVEMLTHKTGNFKQFDVFVSMLKSGLLKTSDSIGLDLLTLEDLEHLRCKKLVHPQPNTKPVLPPNNFNRRYFILTYSAEFDRIHYPLPLDYCGPPDPGVLQNQIRRLESELERFKNRNNPFLVQSNATELQALNQRIKQLSEENSFLHQEIRDLSRMSSKKIKSIKNNHVLQNTLKKLEDQVLTERNHYSHIIQKLREEKKQLCQQVEELRSSERWLQAKLRHYRTLPNPTKAELEHPLEHKKSMKFQRTEAQLTCRPITSWNSTLSTQSKNFRNRSVSRDKRICGRSSSESNSDIMKRKEVTKKVSTNEAFVGSTKPKNFSTTFNRHFSRCLGGGDEFTQMHVETSKPLASRIKRDNSIGSDRPPQRRTVRSRESSLSSNASSRKSKISQSSHQISDRNQSNNIKRQKNFRGPLNRHGIKFSMSDLETRIHALQNLLTDGLSF